jgi:hypothetical protein
MAPTPPAPDAPIGVTIVELDAGEDGTFTVVLAVSLTCPGCGRKNTVWTVPADADRGRPDPGE